MSTQPTGKAEIEPGIVTNDARGLSAFYEAALGFTVDRILELPQGEVHRISRGGALMKFFQPAEPTKVAPERDSWAEFAGWGYAALHVDDALAEFARAEAAGATVLIPVTNHRPGAYFALIADPEGNVWELLQEDHPSNQTEGQG